MSSDIIELKEVIFDPRARGSYCKTPYPNHPNGCPNYPDCIFKHPSFATIPKDHTWFAIIEEFDLRAHAKNMLVKHPHWTDRQCRNPLYWQGGVRKRLMDKARKFKGDYLGWILDIPEACGVEVFETMKLAGVHLEKTHPETVKKVMLVGIRKDVR